MIRRYKKWTYDTSVFWFAVNWYLDEGKISGWAASKKMGKSQTLLYAAQKQGVPLCPSSINLFCDALGLTPFDRKRLHTLAARGVGYEVTAL